ncbi:MAG: DUF86 domain-containing protein [Deltaproteobacteria bacterium]|nr:DUF86 domain-containing protein [Candidatus Zymogenaceae bacterium]
MRDDSARLSDILEAIEAIQRKTVVDKETFKHDEMIQVWVVHHIQIIGEAAAALSKEFRERHTDIPWTDTISMRNVLVHHYFGIDYEQIWDTAMIDIPILKEKILKIMEQSKK